MVKMIYESEGQINARLASSKIINNHTANKKLVEQHYVVCNRLFVILFQTLGPGPGCKS